MTNPAPADSWNPPVLADPILTKEEADEIANRVIDRHALNSDDRLMLAQMLGLAPTPTIHRLAESGARQTITARAREAIRITRALTDAGHSLRSISEATGVHRHTIKRARDGLLRDTKPEHVAALRDHHQEVA